MPSWPGTEVGRAVGCWLREASPSQSPREQGTGATGAEMRLYGEPRTPSSHVPRGKARSQALPSLRRREESKYRRGHWYTYYTQKKKRKGKEKKALEEWYSTESSFTTQETSGNIFDCHSWETATSIQWAEANMLLLSPLQGTGQLPLTKAYPSPGSAVPQLRNPALERKQPSWGRCEQDPTHDPFCPPCPPE